MYDCSSSTLIDSFVAIIFVSIRWLDLFRACLYLILIANAFLIHLEEYRAQVGTKGSEPVDTLPLIRVESAKFLHLLGLHERLFKVVMESL